MSDAALRRLEQTYRPIVSTTMVAEILGLNARTVLLMAQDGRLAASRIPGSRSYRFFLTDVVRMLEENRLEGRRSDDPAVLAGRARGRRRAR